MESLSNGGPFHSGYIPEKSTVSQRPKIINRGAI